MTTDRRTGTTSVSTDMDALELVVSRDFDAPRERVFDAFSSAEHLVHW